MHSRKHCKTTQTISTHFTCFTSTNTFAATSDRSFLDRMHCIRHYTDILFKRNSHSSKQQQMTCDKVVKVASRQIVGRHIKARQGAFRFFFTCLPMALQPMHFDTTYSIETHHFIFLSTTRQSGPVRGIHKRLYEPTRLRCPSACMLDWRLVHPNNPTRNRSVPLG